MEKYVVNERAYCILTNQQQIMDALGILSRVMVGEEYGVPYDKFQEAYQGLIEIRDDIFEMVKTEEVGPV